MTAPLLRHVNFIYRHACNLPNFKKVFDAALRGDAVPVVVCQTKNEYEAKCVEKAYYDAGFGVRRYEIYPVWSVRMRWVVDVDVLIKGGPEK